MMNSGGVDMVEGKSLTGAWQATRLVDIAKRVGVSIGTVSRALADDSGKISVGQRERIRAAAEELGYVPNGAARSLVSRQSRVIGIVVPTLGIGLFSAGVEALQQRLHHASYTLLLANSQYDPTMELREVRAFVERGIDGMVLVGNTRDPKVYELLERNRIPYVNTYVYGRANPYPCIGMDNRDAMYRLTRALLDLGHRDFALVASNTKKNDRAAERVAGVRACLADHGVDLAPMHFLEVPNSIADGRMALRSLLQVGGRMTAVMCTNDLLGMGVLVEARSQQITVPGRLSITGCDNYQISAHLDPPLTSIDAPPEELGERIADYLVARIEGKRCSDAVQLSANLILRESIGRPPAKY